VTSMTGLSLSTDPGGWPRPREGQGWKERAGRLFRGTAPGSRVTGIPSSPFTRWFKPKPCAGAASCQNWEVLISRGVQKGQQRKAFPPCSTWERSFWGALHKCARNARGDFAECLLSTSGSSLISVTSKIGVGLAIGRGVMAPPNAV